MISLFSCTSGNESQAIEKNKSEKAESSDEKEKEEVRNQLDPLVFTRCILIVGGSPSLSPALSIDSIYSSRLQYALDNQYQVLNAATMHEGHEALVTRLQNLPSHQLELIILEIGYDESQLPKADQAFEKKLEKVLSFAKTFNNHPPFFLIPSDFNEKRLNKLDHVVESYPYSKIVGRSEKAIHSPAWHRAITSEIMLSLDHDE